jgi:hypothetical protein
VTRADDGGFTADYLFKDNGRGAGRWWRPTPSGPTRPTRRFAVKGTSTFGAPVEESFSLADGRAKWKSLSELGDLSVMGRALYSPISGTPAQFEVLLQAAATSGGEVALLPSGTLRVRKVAEQALEGPTGKRTVNLMAITVTGFTPTFVWATTDAAPRLFAFIVPASCSSCRTAGRSRPMRWSSDRTRRRARRSWTWQAARAPAPRSHPHPERAGVRQREGGAGRRFDVLMEGRADRSVVPTGGGATADT